MGLEQSSGGHSWQGDFTAEVIKWGELPGQSVEA